MQDATLRKTKQVQPLDEETRKNAASPLPPKISPMCIFPRRAKPQCLRLSGYCVKTPPTFVGLNVSCPNTLRFCIKVRHLVAKVPLHNARYANPCGCGRIGLRVTSIMQTLLLRLRRAGFVPIPARLAKSARRPPTHNWAAKRSCPEGS